MGKTKKGLGAQAFNDYYEKEFGARWASLKAGLQIDPQYIAIHFPSHSSSGDLNEYYLGRASALVGLLTPVNFLNLSNPINEINEKKKVLDLCAAPGGKSLILLSKLLRSLDDVPATPFDNDWALWVNDLSTDRVFRLRETLRTCAPSKLLPLVKITAKRGEDLCLKNSEIFDVILLDAPCSSERHVMRSKKYLGEWTSNRVKSLSIEQYSLLSAAALALKPGGVLVYSTCALAKKENDCVVERLLERHSDFEIYLGDPKDPAFMAPVDDSLIIKKEDKDAIKALSIEKTRFGYSIMPDENSGSGPMFFSFLQKQKQKKGE